MAWDTNHVGSTYAAPGYNKAKSLWESGSGSGVYDGNRVAGFTDQQNNYFNQVGQNFGSTPGYLQNAMNQTGQVASTGGMSQGIQGSLNQLNQIATQGAENPYYKDALGQQLDDIQNRVNASMSGAGRYGSGAHTNVLTDQLSDAATRALNDNWQFNQNLKMAALNSGLQGGLSAQSQGLQAASLTPSLMQGDITRMNELLKSGTYQQSQAQDEINAARDLFNENQQTDWSQLSKYLGAIGSGPAVSSPQQPVTQYQPQQNKPSTAQTILGGATAGLGLLGALGGLF